MRRLHIALSCFVTVIVLGACSAAEQPTHQMAPTDVVATIGSTSVTLADLDAKALQEPASAFGSARLVQAIYVARRATLDEIIATRLIDQEALTRGIPREALVAQEIDQVATPPTDADIEFWYQTNPSAVQGRPLDQLKPAITSVLRQQRGADARSQFVERLKQKTPVTIRLEPPRQTIASAGHPAKGPDDAPVEIVEFSDFECPFCQRATPAVNQVLDTYGDRIRFVYRHFPLPNHPNARPAAEAAACANEQGRFWPYHDRLFASPDKLTGPDLKAHAAAVGLDEARFSACVADRRFETSVDQDVKDAQAAGVTGTPAFFINGRSLEGAQPFEAFKRVIDEELAATRK